MFQEITRDKPLPAQPPFRSFALKSFLQSPFPWAFLAVNDLISIY